MNGIRKAPIVLALVLSCAFFSACGHDDEGPATPPLAATATPSPSPGPLVTFLGVARADDMLILPSGTTASGLPIYQRTNGAGFVLVVEGKPGSSRSPVGLSSFQDDLTSFPDLQIIVSRPLGNGSAAVCDVSRPGPVPTASPAGGVPATSTTTFDLTQTNIDTVNDLACRFRDGQGNPMGLDLPDACVLFPSGEFGFSSADSTIQFCATVTDAFEFPPGDTIVTVRLRDEAGNTGPSAQMVVRIAP